LSKDFVPAIRTDEVAPGGMKPVEIAGREVVVCNCDGKFYAFQRRCGHMNAPLDMGTLDGTILTCPMHCAQFDVITGEALSGPVPHDFGGEVPPPRVGQFLGNVSMLMEHVRTESVRTFPARVEGGFVCISLSP
jgi:nitrite reductase/ring-hydroxylating ferredoxin subunit